MQDKSENKQPGANLPVASPKPSRSKIAEIEHLGRGTRPARRVTDGKTNTGEASPPDTTLETATRIAADFIAQESLEKATLAAQADNARLELNREREERRVATIAAEARLEAVDRNLAIVHDDAASIRKSLSRERKFLLVAGLAAAVLITAALTYRWPEFPASPALPVTSASRSRTAILLPQSQYEPSLNTSGAGFADGLDRLNLTLASAGGRKPEDAIRIIRTTRNPAVCPFVWRNGQVSLTFNEDTELSSLTKIFYGCANAVAQLP